MVASSSAAPLFRKASGAPWSSPKQFPKALKGLPYIVTHKPVLFGALLKHHRQLGPAEIPGKREWTYRQVAWLAHQYGLVLQMPATHPFNPLTLLRMAVASDAKGLPNRYVCETIFRHVWQGGFDPNDPARLAALAEQLPREVDPSGDEVKARLKAHTKAAIDANKPRIDIHQAKSLESGTSP